MATREKNRALTYLRRSSPGQEASLEIQINWAINEAQRHHVRLDAAHSDVKLMMEQGFNSHKGLR